MYRYYLIWYDDYSKVNYKVGLLTINNKQYTFNYLHPFVDEAIKHGFTFYPGFFDIDEIYTSSSLFNNIALRLPNLSNLNYINILNKYDLDYSSSQSDILNKTGARLITDNFSFVPIFDKVKTYFCLKNKDYSQDLDKVIKIIKRNDSLDLKDEDNSYSLYYKSYLIGLVPEYYYQNIKDIKEKNIPYSIVIDKVVNINNLLPNKIFVKMICETI